MHRFTHYDEWRDAITGVCGLVLAADYCASRAAALQDEFDPSTRAFVAAYGADYRDQVAAWFARAGKEAEE
jgi:hypothetical protein